MEKNHWFHDCLFQLIQRNKTINKLTIYKILNNQSQSQHHQVTRVIHYPPSDGHTDNKALRRGARLVEQFDPVYPSKTILQRRLN